MGLAYGAKRGTLGSNSEVLLGVQQLVRHRASAASHMAALAELLEQNPSDAAQLFGHGLSLLVEELGVDRALLTRVTGLGYEAFWWAGAPGVSLAEVIEAPEKGFCPFLLAHPERTLTIRDAANEARWRGSSGYKDLGIRAYAGVALSFGGSIKGTLCLHQGVPRTFTHADISLLRAMGQLMARTLEHENLKQEFQATLDSLQLSSAIVEDSALLGAHSGLPNRRYLDIWVKSALFLARRRREPMALVLWSQPMVSDTKKRLTAACSSLRGEDLMVELSTDQYLLVMPRTSEEGASVLWERLKEILGDHPAGATMWLPVGQDMTLKSALKRVAEAFTHACSRGTNLSWQRS
jgi:GGDEF domain-containing protein